MEIPFEKKELTCMTHALREVQNSEQTQELRLPDGMPDIGRVLCAWGQVILRSKEWRSDSILVTGGLLMWVLYAPEDGSKPQVLDGWLPFQMRWSLPDGCPEGTIRVAALTRFADARSISPRKLMLRGGVGILAEAWIPEKLELCQPGELPEGVELLKRKYPVRLPREAGEKTFAQEETLSLGTVPEHLLYYTLRPEITEQKVLANKIAIRGNGNFHAAWLDGEGNAASEDFAMPFSQIVELPESFSSDAATDVQCSVTNLEVELGENGQLHVKTGMAAQYLVDDLQMIDVVEDAYSPGMELNAVSGTLNAPSVLERRTESAVVEATLAVNNAQIAEINILSDLPHQYREGDGIALEIPGTVQALYTDSSGKLQAVSCRWEYRQQVKIGTDAVLTAIPGAAQNPQFTYAGENVIVRGELPMHESVTGGSGIPMVTMLELGSQTEPDPSRPSLILRRSGGESLWELAKRCGSTVAAIQSANGIREEPHPGQMLLIPVL